jgi:aspartyl-tRNA(Asn)/glutamyl-tRNA(Gln) amidotransferase subunit C
MALTKDTIRQVAHLARIHLNPDELERLSEQLKEILSFIDKLNKLDVKDINPTSHILPINNVFRDDKLKSSLSVDKALENAPLKQENFFGVPKIIE